MDVAARWRSPDTKHSKKLEDQNLGLVIGVAVLHRELREITKSDMIWRNGAHTSYGGTASQRTFVGRQ